MPLKGKIQLNNSYLSTEVVKQTEDERNHSRLETKGQKPTAGFHFESNFFPKPPATATYEDMNDDNDDQLEKALTLNISGLHSVITSVIT